MTAKACAMCGPLTACWLIAGETKSNDSGHADTVVVFFFKFCISMVQFWNAFYMARYTIFIAASSLENSLRPK